VFSLNRKTRDAFARNKDAVLLPILEDIDIPEPDGFTALLMPALYGIEAFHLVDRGVPASNLFAIENNRHGPGIHEEIRACQREDRQELYGMRTTRTPQSLLPALAEARLELGVFDLIYLDFLSQPDKSTLAGLRAVFRAEMLAPGGTLILTFGRNRTSRNTAGWNKRLRCAAEETGLANEVQLLVKLLLQEYDDYDLSFLGTGEYKSQGLCYHTTVARFCPNSISVPGSQWVGV
jgi:hypothetical protein